MKAEDKALVDIFYHLENGGDDRAKKELEQYAAQCVIEELKNLQVGIPTGMDGTLMFIRLNKRIKELKLIKKANQE